MCLALSKVYNITREHLVPNITLTGSYSFYHFTEEEKCTGRSNTLPQIIKLFYS